MREEMNSRPILDERGMTLIEIMIAAGISIVLAFALATMISNTTKQESNIRVKQEAHSYQQQLRYERKVTAPPPADP